jgi:autoinducer binding domain-containing protein
MAPLVDAVASGSDLIAAVTTIVQSLGFDTFMYGLTTVFRPGHDSFVYIFTTAPQAWVQLYDQRAYIEIDPRIEAATTSTLPHIWDQVTERGRSVRSDKFLDDAARHGICSGVSFLLPDSNRASVILCLNSSMLASLQRLRGLL